LTGPHKLFRTNIFEILWQRGGRKTSPVPWLITGLAHRSSTLRLLAINPMQAVEAKVTAKVLLSGLMDATD
jgi:hypothetical protein